MTSSSRSGPAETTVGDLFARQVTATPDSLAVVDGTSRRSYAELAADVDALAGLLVERGVGPEIHVGVLLPRSYALVVALLAVLRAGGVYVPLNPDVPDARLRALIEDTAPAAVVTDRSLRARGTRLLGVRPATTLVCLESGRAGQPSGAALDLAGRHAANAAAYVIQTSGSTGEPKSVQVEMRSLVNLLAWYRETCRIDGRSRVGQIVASSFDASLKNYLASLLAGAALMLHADGPYDPQAMLDFIADEQISVLNPGVPAQIYPVIELAAAGGYRALESLRCLALGGDATDLTRLEPWLESGRCRARIVNVYGPTECADIACYAELSLPA